MMRESFFSQLEALHVELIRMGALCEDAIASAIKGLLDEDDYLRNKAIELESAINLEERKIEDDCLRLIIREQPVAGDLRRVSAAQKMISNMERIGDQAADIAEISVFLAGSDLKGHVHIADLARAVVSMLQRSVDSFVAGDIGVAREVIATDDVADDLFMKIKSELSHELSRDEKHAGQCLDLLMIAKYLERIGDHAVNIAEQVVYMITGERGENR